MRNPSVPRLSADDRAAAQFVSSFRGARAPRTFTRWIRYLQFLTLLALSAGVSLAQSIPPDIAKRLDDLAARSVRVNKEQKTEGLDLSMHGEEGYHFEA